ncbi:MAG: ABC transporter ATP-binding protein [Saprospiraceae bacterium]|jgi:ABC-type multidrug transport system fused ATPase/permease subunit|nr:ABC transporter ATP-binding protein/permease [Saprospiraceae bacterium]MDG1433280.1 ABC transporter ATP-binding protein [Saprospiraceae bacterium]MDG2418595.1 ABC transporter ATP-binding protein [Saprospiraceae bacterium]
MLRKLLRYLQPYRRNVILNIICNVFMALFTIVSIPAIIPFLQILFDIEAPVIQKPDLYWSAVSIIEYSKYWFSNLMHTESKEIALAYICIFIVLLFLLKNVFRYLSLFFMAPVRNGIVRDVRQQLFNKMMALPLSYFSEEKKGDLMSRITTDVMEIEWSILNVLEAFFREPLIMFGCLGLMIYLSPALTMFVFVLIIFTAIIIGGIGKTLKKKSSTVQEKLGSLVSIVEEGLSGLRIIKGFNAEKYQEEKFQKENNDYKRTLTHLLWRRDLSSPLTEFLGIAVVSILLWYGSRQVFSGELGAESFFAFLMAFYYVIDPAKSFSKAYYNFQKGAAAVDRVDHILNAEETIKEKKNALSIKKFNHSIEYRDVNFFYRKDEKKILNNINLIIPKGKIIALVGASGAGKSTLADLLPRFYDVSSGEVIIDGRNIKELKIKDLRHLMGIVSQEAILFNDTIYNNIVFGLKNISKEQVIEATKIANAHDFILNTENGYETNIGDRGNKLSGGQRQRITIARAVLKNPPILILDEATSALDSESEKLVQQSLTQLMKNRTSIVIAHRLSTIQHADEIIVMQDGTIIERGRHEILLGQKGAYQKLVELQTF